MVIKHFLTDFEQKLTLYLTSNSPFNCGEIMKTRRRVEFWQFLNVLRHLCWKLILLFFDFDLTFLCEEIHRLSGRYEINDRYNDIRKKISQGKKNDYLLALKAAGKKGNDSLHSKTRTFSTLPVTLFSNVRWSLS